MVSRAERSFFADYWWTVDRWQIAALGALMVLGLVLMLAGSPPEAERLNLSTYYFVHRQVAAMILAAAIMLAVSFLSPRQVRRAALIVFAISLTMVVATLLIGHEIKGSRRWILGVQPSEFIKPAFAVLAAWAFAEGASRRRLEGNLIAIALLPLTIVPLILQPDIGQTMLISLVWAALFFMAGLHWFWVVGIGGVGVTGVGLAYKFLPHVHQRIQSFFEPAEAAGGANHFQVETALDSFTSGGWFGKGPGEGTIKRVLPDSHTDFLFAVAGEEFGVVFCLFLAGLFAFVVLRGLMAAARNEDPFCRFAASGLVMQFGVQSCINMSVNLRLIPAKGMTLPFISYGGSSLIALAIGMGFLIAVTRKRPRSEIFIAAPEPLGLAA